MPCDPVVKLFEVSLPVAVRQRVRPVLLPPGEEEAGRTAAIEPREHGEASDLELVLEPGSNLRRHERGQLRRVAHGLLHEEMAVVHLVGRPRAGDVEDAIRMGEVPLRRDRADALGGPGGGLGSGDGTVECDVAHVRQRHALGCPTGARDDEGA